MLAAHSLRLGLKHAGVFRGLRDQSTRNTGLLQRRIDKIQRDRHKWAESAMESIVPADIARAKQVELARQLTSLTTELAALEAAGVDTEATLNQLLDQIADPGKAYRKLEDGMRRTDNQAWFNRIYIDVIPDDPNRSLQADTDRTAITQALEACREMVLAAENNSADPEGSADVVDIGNRLTRGSINDPFVELRGLEPLTPTLPVWCATSCAIAPLFSCVLARSYTTATGSQNLSAQDRRHHRLLPAYS